MQVVVFFVHVSLECSHCQLDVNGAWVGAGVVEWRKMGCCTRIGVADNVGWLWNIEWLRNFI